MQGLGLIKRYVRAHPSQALKVAALLDSVSQALKNEHATQQENRRPGRRVRHPDP